MAQFIISAFADEASDLLCGQIAALKRNGLRLIEPRSIEGNAIKKTDEELYAIRAALDEVGIGLSSLGSPCGKFDIKEDFEIHLKDFRRALTACKILGTDRMRMFSFFVTPEELDTYRDEVIRRLKIMLDEAKAAGVTLCHENEHKIYGEAPERVRDLLTALPELRGIFDAANYVMEGADAMEGAKATLPYLSYIHIKDAHHESQTILPAGEGEGQILDVLNLVNETYDRPIMLTLEPHLNKFTAFASIDTHELKGKYSFKDNTESFDFAVATLRALLEKGGYKEENGKWKK
jgi:sugar phosphate isomerase/epimerase